MLRTLDLREASNLRVCEKTDSLPAKHAIVDLMKHALEIHHFDSMVYLLLTSQAVAAVMASVHTITLQVVMSYALALSLTVFPLKFVTEPPAHKMSSGNGDTGTDDTVL